MYNKIRLEMTSKQPELILQVIAFLNDYINPRVASDYIKIYLKLKFGATSACEFPPC